MLRPVSGAQSSDLDASIAIQTKTVDLDDSMHNLGSADTDAVSGMCLDAVVAGSPVREDGAGSDMTGNAYIEETIPYGMDHVGNEELTDDILVVSDAVFPGLTVSDDGTGGASVSNTDLDDTIAYGWGDTTEAWTEGKMTRDLSVGTDSRAESYLAIMLSSRHDSVNQVITYNITRLLVLWNGVSVMCTMSVLCLTKEREQWWREVPLVCEESVRAWQ